MVSGNDENKLKKRVGFIGLLAMCVGLNIGGALFALTSKAAFLTGPSLQGPRIGFRSTPFRRSSIGHKP